MVASVAHHSKIIVLNDAGMIRNRLKINSAIENARRIQTLRTEYGLLS